ncbi:hypothetical protein UFOVP249_43 [uncultured Caudovirales phage]|uniref:Uncharacterized protein n=1 Tax=uncultured Caudovirales phage TaxID=2100421 RepID=A0A6J5LDU3_9CAUD|nr:hypothetical protein UFOVP249_43 [uncultured Caudovirales phage]
MSAFPPAPIQSEITNFVWLDWFNRLYAVIKQIPVFGSYTASAAPPIVGYITVVDSAGITRRLAVV